MEFRFATIARYGPGRGTKHYHAHIAEEEDGEHTVELEVRLYGTAVPLYPLWRAKVNLDELRELEEELGGNRRGSREKSAV